MMQKGLAYNPCNPQCFFCLDLFSSFVVRYLSIGQDSNLRPVEINYINLKKLYCSTTELPIEVGVKTEKHSLK